ncbi:MAG: signal peptidase I [Planctomycetota bacterium]|nr:signal peptidase I [Planctomycetota bacterium]
METEPRIAKEPWLAVNLSLVLPGLGQFYARDWGLGLLFLFGWAALLAGMMWAVFCPRANMVLALPFGAAFLGLIALNLWSAHRCARRANSPEAEAWRKQFKDPFLAVFLTRFLSGVGHLYLKKWIVGVLLIGVAVGMAVALRGLLVVHLIVWSVYAAAISLWAWRCGPAQRRGGVFTIAALAALIAGIGLSNVGLALLFRQYVVRAYNVPVASMAPTIQPGDRILVLMGASYRPQRGDLVVFRNPMDRAQDYVKRIAALEGETVEFKDDGTYVNGVKLVEGLWGRIPHVAVAGQEYAAEGEPFTVPPGHIFVVGDNTHRSFDSRFFGPIPISDVKGKAYKRYWPLDRAGPLE